MLLKEFFAYNNSILCYLDGAVIFYFYFLLLKIEYGWRDWF